MFTGIISHLGIIKKKTATKLLIQAENDICSKLAEGMSISINGICLTVTSYDDSSFAIDYMPETAKKTTIAFLQEGDKVNLELPATPQTFLAGHIVQGHIDGVGKISKIQEEGNSHIISITFPGLLQKYIVEKGSVTINGISLTVIDIHGDILRVGIIPHTWSKTMLHTVQENIYVNIEVDVIAKHIERLIKH